MAANPNLFPGVLTQEQLVNSLQNEILSSSSPKADLDQIASIVRIGYSGHQWGEVVSDEALRTPIVFVPGVNSQIVATRINAEEELLPNVLDVVSVIGVGIPDEKVLDRLDKRSNLSLEPDYLMMDPEYPDETITAYLKSFLGSEIKVASLGPLTLINPITGEVAFDFVTMEAMVRGMEGVSNLLAENNITHVVMIARKGLIDIFNQAFEMDFTRVPEFVLRENAEMPDGITSTEIFDSYPGYWRRGYGPSLYYGDFGKLRHSLNKILKLRRENK